MASTAAPSSRLRPRGLRPAAALLVLAALLTGCSGLGQAHMRGDPFRADSEGIVFLEVRNTLGEEVRIRVRSQAGGMDLGSVPARTVTRLTFPWGDFGRLSLQLEPATGSRFTLPPLEVHAGEVLELIIQSPVDRSTLRR